MADPLLSAIAVASASTVLYVLVLLILFYFWPSQRLQWETVLILALGVFVAVFVTVFARELGRLSPERITEAVKICATTPECVEALGEAVRR